MGYVNGNVKVNGTGLFSANNDKTACPAWSISHKFCAGKKGSICGKCYAQNGCYRFPSTIKALIRRGNWFTKCPENIVVGTITRLIQKQKNKYIRVFESGDFSSIADIKKWIKIARDCTNHEFWFPTRTWWRADFLQHLRILNSLPNVAVRPSALDFDENAPEVEGLAAGTAAYSKNAKPQKGHFDCPGSCEGCRKCWDSTTKVTYHFH